METTLNQKIEKIQSEMHQLREKFSFKSDEFKNQLAEYKLLEIKLKDLKTEQLLQAVNQAQAEKRKTALLAYNCEEPAEDITTNDGCFHKTKIKKYPNLSALNYARAKFENGKITQLNIGRESFIMYFIYTEDSIKKYTRPENFNQFLELNNIMLQDISMKEFKTLENELNQANEDLENALKLYDERKNALNIYQLQMLGLITQSNKHIYKYETK